MRHGRFFEDFTPGAILEHWPGRTIGQGDHRLFCLLTMNVSHDGPGVHEAYLFALLAGLSMSDVSANAIHHTESDIRVLGGVAEGDTIRVTTEVLSVEDVPGKADRGLVALETRGYTQTGALFMSYRRRMAIRRAPPA